MKDVKTHGKVILSLRTPIFQFGTSRFLQAHVDLFLSQAGGDDGKVSVIASSGSSTGRARLQALIRKDGFPVIIRGVESREQIEFEVIVKSIVRAYDAEQDWPKLIEDFVEQAEFVVSNTTERGFFLPAGYELDLSEAMIRVPVWYPAKLTTLLFAAFVAGRSGLVILPTELVGRNGDTLKSIVLSLARHEQVGEGFRRWLDQECVFANSLVDRIVSEPIEPAGAITEPYALWAIEGQPRLKLPCIHPAIKIVTDLEPVERLKIHILNLGHTMLAEQWLRDGSTPNVTVREALRIEKNAAMLSDIFADEVLPGFSNRGMKKEAEKYIQVTLDRFTNPFLNHRLSDIATGHAEKVEKRIASFIQWAKPDYDMPRLLAIAANYSNQAA